MFMYFLMIVTCSLVAKQPGIDDRLQSMTLDQKIGQLFMVQAVSDVSLNEEYLKKACYRAEPAYVSMLIKEYHVGGIIFLGTATKATIKQSIQFFQEQSAIPLFIGLDAEWGTAMRIKDGTCYEKNNVLGLRSDEEVRQIGALIGAECKELGIHINFAPVVDVNTNPSNPVIGARAFGQNPEHVARKGIAYMQGLQSAGVLACAKHFPGHGDTDVDSHVQLPILRHSIERLFSVELLPFKKIIAAGVDAVMIGHLSVPALDGSGRPASFSKPIIELLRQDVLFEGLAVSDVLGHPILSKSLAHFYEPFNFNGLVITDGLDMGALTEHCAPGEIELHALLAGNDMLLCPIDVPKAVEYIKQAIKEHTLSIDELDEHVRRILRARAKVGLR